MRRLPSYFGFFITILFPLSQGKQLWTYKCETSQLPGRKLNQPRCVKISLTQGEDPVGINACKMTCNQFGVLWPKPTGDVFLGEELYHFYPEDLNYEIDYKTPEAVQKYLNKFMNDVFKNYLHKSHPKYDVNDNTRPFGNLTTENKLSIVLNVEQSSIIPTLEDEESYNLIIGYETVTRTPTKLRVQINAKTYFGARHGLETLSQLISFDDVSRRLIVNSAVRILNDNPKYQHRGILVDTSRNFIELPILRSIIDAMSYVKMNVFHWHITDTSSFPFESSRVPELTELGAYSVDKVYETKDIKDLVNYAALRGVKIIPELDTPAHVGAGWEFGKSKGLGNLVLCFNEEPWESYCVEPPCGQLNPVNNATYDVLRDIYQDFFDVFPSDMFHMGGDEIHLNCWNSTKEIQNWMKSKGKTGSKEDFLDLWAFFQKEAKSRVYEANGGKKLPIILWTNGLTESESSEVYIKPEDYIIQVWTKSDDQTIPKLVNKGYKTIFSNTDAWYLDCGYAGWVAAGNNWCSPYKGWQLIYDNSPRNIYLKFKDADPERINSILGGEVAMWSEQVDGPAIQSKLWPRSAAAAERLWSDPDTSWQEAEYRMIHNRRRMVSRGIAADALQPEWCHQNEGSCSIAK